MSSSSIDLKPRVKYFNPGGNTIKAVFSIVIGNSFVVHGVKVVQGKKGIFVAMPSRCLNPDDDTKREFLDIFHPVKKESKGAVDNLILSEYYRLCDLRGCKST